jgi:adenosylhomocysteine nucleosidase
MTLACATKTEERVARKLGARTALVGIGARRDLPDGPVVSFGLAGGLHDGLECGEVLDATRVVDADGVVLWEGGPLGAAGARIATILAVDEIVDDPEERRTLHERTGADAIDMESGVLARSGRLAGCLRAISDTPSRPLGPLTEMMDANGKLRPGGIVRAIAAPRRTGRALADVRRALMALQQVVTRPDGVVA